VGAYVGGAWMCALLPRGEGLGCLGMSMELIFSRRVHKERQQ
jgi:hypothetical protein